MNFLGNFGSTDVTSTYRRKVKEDILGYTLQVLLSQKQTVTIILKFSPEKVEDGGEVLGTGLGLR